MPTEGRKIVRFLIATFGLLPGRGKVAFYTLVWETITTSTF
nr:MAG TPA: hypothetical protein [Caudoviricetes sp.]DAP64663.1 MAG TPA: hypothetical protein [Caudoviricetes sp.]DAP87806.1 MAG TPA: hypothetical protein [Caudoviricetes sp.]DAQ38396.1 MAG TPA: hypothetical protein [Caudoviricetes sp.]